MLSDYYITVTDTNDDLLEGLIDTIRFQVRIVPLISLLWFGCILLFITIIPLVIVSYKKYKWSYQKVVLKTNFSNATINAPPEVI